MWRNQEKSYGVVTKILHWIIALLFLGQYYWVYWREYILPPKSELGLYYLRNLHKPLGVVLLGLAVAAIIWKILEIKPEYPNSMPQWEKNAAKIVQLVLYFSMLTMPITGIVMSMAGGYPISMFGWFDLPQLMTKNKQLASFCYQSHEIISYIALVAVAIHITAAMKHHFIDKDNILKRMGFSIKSVSSCDNKGPK